MFVCVCVCVCVCGGGGWGGVGGVVCFFVVVVLFCFVLMHNGLLSK